MFGSKNKKQPSVTIVPQKTPVQELEELPPIQPPQQQVQQPVKMPEEFVYVVAGVMLENGAYQYTVQTNQKLTLGLQED